MTEVKIDKNVFRIPQINVLRYFQRRFIFSYFFSHPFLFHRKIMFEKLIPYKFHEMLPEKPPVCYSSITERICLHSHSFKHFIRNFQEIFIKYFDKNWITSLSVLSKSWQHIYDRFVLCHCFILRSLITRQCLSSIFDTFIQFSQRREINHKTFQVISAFKQSFYCL